MGYNLAIISFLCSKNNGKIKFKDSKQESFLQDNFIK